MLDAATLSPVEIAWSVAEASFPYVPGLLSFREIPGLVRAFERLESPPDLVVVDGHGIAHPRRLGIASHLGVIFDLPTIGCAKKRLVGSYEMPARRRGSHRPLVHKGEVVGEVLRTKDGVKPVFVSTGHKVSLPTAQAWVLRLCRGYRLPETTRAAHAEVNRLRREGQEGL